MDTSPSAPNDFFVQTDAPEKTLVLIDLFLWMREFFTYSFPRSISSSYLFYVNFFQDGAIRKKIGATRELPLLIFQNFIIYISLYGFGPILSIVSANLLKISGILTNSSIDKV